MTIDARVLPCPACGAPLPQAADGAHVKCSACGAQTTVHTGAAEAMQEERSRREAEALYATLGEPPTWSQRAAVWLVNPWLWLFGFPFLVALLVRVAVLPTRLLVWGWEKAFHERLMHVAPPVWRWVLDVGPLAALAVALLVWSLLGLRVDARRELQAALAARPPKIPGGPAGCQACGADLAVPPGALGVRCRYCGADSLVMLPPAWVARARKIERTVQLGLEVARKQDDEGRRRVRRAALWRVPVALATVSLFALPMVALANAAGFSDLRPAGKVQVFLLGHGRWPGRESTKVSLHAYPACDDARAVDRLSGDATVKLSAPAECQAGSCYAPALFALARGDRLRLLWRSPAAHVNARWALGPRDPWSQKDFVAAGWGEEIQRSGLTGGKAGATALELRAEVSGFHKLELEGPADAALEACIVRASR